MFGTDVLSVFQPGAVVSFRLMGTFVPFRYIRGSVAVILGPRGGYVLVFRVLVLRLTKGGNEDQDGTFLGHGLASCLFSKVWDSRPTVAFHLAPGYYVTSYSTPLTQMDGMNGCECELDA